MNTAQKRELLEHRSKKMLYTMIDKIDNGEFREIDQMCQDFNDPVFLTYLITLLCDELVYLTNDTEGE